MPRPPWSSLPSHVRAWAQDVLGSPVVASASALGGFSPGVASRLRCADGSRGFVKAADQRVNLQTADLHRREARVTAALPATAGAPQLLSSYDEGGWVVLLLEDIPGRPPRQPWDDGELGAALALLDRNAVALTPAPVEVERLSEDREQAFTGWRSLAADPPDDLSDWEAAHLHALAEAEPLWEQAAYGESLLHGDVRADNMLVRPDGSLVLVDWPWAARGAPLVDLVWFAPSVRLHGGPAPDELLARSAVGRGGDPEAVTLLALALAGYMQYRCRQPAPAGLPTVRAFQAAQGAVAVEWLRQRPGWV